MKNAFTICAIALIGIAASYFKTENQPANLNTQRDIASTQADASMTQSSPLHPDSLPCGIQIKQHLLTFKGGLENTFFRNDTIGRSFHVYLETRADNYTPPATSIRQPVNLAIVIDRSGSMAGDKLKYAKEAARFVVTMLEPTDFVSIVMYDDDVNVLVKATLVKDKQSILRKIDSIVEDGSTNLCGGMMEGYHQDKTFKQPTLVNKVLLLSDGLVNVGIQNSDDITAIVKREDNQEGIAISTFGIGLDFNEDLMTKIAESGNGNYYFIKDAQNIPSIFDKELSGILKVVAQNVRVEIDLPKGVTASKSYGFDFILEGQKLKINLRDIYSEETKAMLIKFNIEDGYAQPLAMTCKLIYDDAVLKSTMQVIPINLTVVPTTNIQSYQTAFTPCVMQQIALFESNARLEEAMRLTQQGDYSGAQNMIMYSRQQLAHTSGFYGKTEELSRMDSLNTDYEEKNKDYKNKSAIEQKEIQKSSKESNYKMRAKK